MTTRLPVEVADALPLLVENVELFDPVVVMSGEEWSMAIACPWRLTVDGEVVSSIDDPFAESKLRDLVGVQVLDILGPAEHPRDWSISPMLLFATGARLEVMSDTDLDPWVMRLPNLTIVGRGPGSH